MRRSQCTRELSFTKYAILGDDIVIADRLVAVQYRKLIEQLGLSISLNKTLLSESGTCEFAKPFILRSGEKGGNSPQQEQQSWAENSPLLSRHLLLFFLSKEGKGVLSLSWRMLSFRSQRSKVGVHTRQDPRSEPSVKELIALSRRFRIHMGKSRQRRFDSCWMHVPRAVQYLCENFFICLQILPVEYLLARRKVRSHSCELPCLLLKKKKIDPNQIRSSLKEACKQGLSVTLLSSERAKVKPSRIVGLDQEGSVEPVFIHFLLSQREGCHFKISFFLYRMLSFFDTLTGPSSSIGQVRSSSLGWVLSHFMLSSLWHGTVPLLLFTVSPQRERKCAKSCSGLPKALNIQN